MKMVINKILHTRSTYAADTSEVASHAIDISIPRIKFTAAVVALIFSILILRILDLRFTNLEEVNTYKPHNPNSSFFISRANIVDRNGELLASNIITASAYAHPNHIINIDQAATQLEELKIGLNKKNLLKLFSSKKSFVWIKRHLTPQEQQKIHDLGFPGIYFSRDERRIYPHGSLFSHILGYANIDGQGIAGLERMYNGQLQHLAKQNVDLQLSLDVRVQNVLKTEIQKGIEEQSAIGGSGIVMNVNNGEILGMLSLPDFDPHHPDKELRKNFFNQNTLGVYEMGSTFKVFTVAMGLDMGAIKLNDDFDVSRPLRIGKFTINDYRGKGGRLSVPEILQYSSNLGAAQIAQLVTIKNQKNYLRKLGLFAELKEEVPETTKPLYPDDKNWREASLITISYGHGMAVTPIHLAQSFSSVVNGGLLYKPQLLLQPHEKNHGRRVFKSTTSETMRKLLMLVAQEGSAQKAKIDEYLVGGKTGTTEKNNGKHYNKKANIAIFIGAFPMNKPEYLVLVIIDEAKANKKNFGFTTGGMIAAPIAKNIIEKIAPILNIQAQDYKDLKLLQTMQLDYTPRYIKRTLATR